MDLSAPFSDLHSNVPVKNSLNSKRLYSMRIKIAGYACFVPLGNIFKHLTKKVPVLQVSYNRKPEAIETSGSMMSQCSVSQMARIGGY